MNLAPGIEMSVCIARTRSCGVGSCAEYRGVGVCIQSGEYRGVGVCTLSVHLSVRLFARSLLEVVRRTGEFRGVGVSTVSVHFSVRLFARSLLEVVRRTGEFGESNSILVIGPRGSGKTMVGFLRPAPLVLMVQCWPCSTISVAHSQLKLESERNHQI